MYSLSLFIVYFKFTVDTQTTSKKPHCHDEKDDINMRTGKQRKRKNDISVDNSSTKKPSFNDDNGNDRTEDSISTFSGFNVIINLSK